MPSEIEPVQIDDAPADDEPTLDDPEHLRAEVKKVRNEARGLRQRLRAAEGERDTFAKERDVLAAEKRDAEEKRRAELRRKVDALPSHLRERAPPPDSDPRLIEAFFAGLDLRTPAPPPTRPPPPGGSPKVWSEEEYEALSHAQRQQFGPEIRRAMVEGRFLPKGR